MKDFFKLREELEIRQQLSESLSSIDHKEHIKTIDNHTDEHSEKDGLHTDHDPKTLAKVHHAHTQLARMHDAHALVHRANGDHQAADAHENAAHSHHTLASVSVKHPRWADGSVVSRHNRETHEEYAHAASSANSDSEHAMKHHSIK